MADPELLSMLEKVSNPLTEVNLTINLKGVFAPPEQWYSLFYLRKITDEANPNIFTYTVGLLDKCYLGGKI